MDLSSDIVEFGLLGMVLALSLKSDCFLMIGALALSNDGVCQLPTLLRMKRTLLPILTAEAVFSDVAAPTVGQLCRKAFRTHSPVARWGPGGTDTG